MFLLTSTPNRITLQSETLTAAIVVSGFTNAATGVISTASASNTTDSKVSGLSVETYGTAQTAIALVDSALNTINTTRATLGAVQSRFESAVASQQTTSENLSASRSRVQGCGLCRRDCESCELRFFSSRHCNVGPSQCDSAERVGITSVIDFF